MLGYPYLMGDFSRDELQSIEEEIEKKAIEFSRTSKNVNIFMFTQYGLRQSFSGDI